MTNDAETYIQTENYWITEDIADRGSSNFILLEKFQMCSKKNLAKARWPHKWGSWWWGAKSEKIPEGVRAAS